VDEGLGVVTNPGSTFDQSLSNLWLMATSCTGRPVPLDGEPTFSRSPGAGSHLEVQVPVGVYDRVVVFLPCEVQLITLLELRIWKNLLANLEEVHVRAPLRMSS
jgi:hypothetical protein